MLLRHADTLFRIKFPDRPRPHPPVGSTALFRDPRENPEWLKFSDDDWALVFPILDAEHKAASEAFSRWNDVRVAIAAAAERGSLAIGYRPKEGGKIQVCPQHWWATDKLADRFALCLIDPQKPFGAGIDGSRYCQLFVVLEDFERMIAEIAQPPLPLRPENVAEEVWLSPYLEVMIEAARQSGIRPGADGQVKIDLIKYIIQNIAASRGVPLTGNDLSAMASLIREPAARSGIRKMKADQRMGVTPKNL